MFRKTVLDNGIKVLTERIPHVLSAVIGFWVETGSRFEDESDAGYSHFLEHMMFKGTKKRSARDIASQIDKIGAHINAATNKEYTIYFIHSMADHLDFGVEMLSDIMQNSLFDRTELEREKKVVLEEIKMYEDSPEDTLGDLFMRTFFPGHPLGRPIIGNEKTIGSAGRDRLVSFFERNYHASNLCVSIAGRIPSDRFLKRLEKLKLPGGNVVRVPEPPAKLDFSRQHADKDIQQVHFMIGFPGVSGAEELRFPMYVLNAVLGGGISSRLFQEIREKRGLCYSIQSFQVTYCDTGTLQIYCATDGKTLSKTVDAVLKVCRSLRRDLVTPKELRETKEQIKGQLSLASENIEFLMNRMTMQERIFGKYITMDKMFREIDAIRMKDIDRLVSRVFGTNLDFHFASVGPKGHSRSLPS